jgi:ABC-type histidine transport system ATPase subunit
MLPEWIKDLETLFSLLAFAITVYVMYEVRAIRNSFKSRARLPEIIKDLSASGSSISKLLKDWPLQEREVKGHVKSTLTILTVSVEFLSGEQKSEIKKLRARLKIALAAFGPSTDAWELYTDVQNAVQILTQASKNAKWD